MFIPTITIYGMERLSKGGLEASYGSECGREIGLRSGTNVRIRDYLVMEVSVHTDNYHFCNGREPPQGGMEASDGMGLANGKLRKLKSSRPNT